MSLSAHHIIIEDEELSLGSTGDLSFVAGPMDDFFSGLDSPSFGVTASPPQSPTSFSLTQSSQSPPPSTSAAPSSTAAATMQYPRMVSVDSMSNVASSPRRKASKSTHLQSLQDLILKKQQQKQSGALPRAGLKRSATSASFLRRSSLTMRSSTESRIASVFQKPSLVLQKIVEDSELHQESANKKRKLEPTALHEACRRSNVTVKEVEDVLAQDPCAATRPASLYCKKTKYDHVTGKLNDVEVKETHQYPLNLAIQYQVSSDVLERLVAAAPSVLTTGDGPTKQIPLHILMRHKPHDDAAANMMLLKHPDICGIRDTKNNTALHLAVAHGASADIVRNLVVLYPAALSQHNFHGQTPLALAQRAGNVCGTGVVDYLWTQVEDQF